MNRESLFRINVSFALKSVARFTREGAMARRPSWSKERYLIYRDSEHRIYYRNTEKVCTGVARLTMDDIEASDWILTQEPVVRTGR